MADVPTVDNPFSTVPGATSSNGSVSAQSGTSSTNTNMTGTQQQQGTANQQQANTYGAGQQALQQQLPSTLSNFLNTGNLPGTFAAPSDVLAAYNSNFQQSVAPGLAAQYGAGSPEIGSQQSLGLQQLLSNLNQTQSNNFNNVLNTGSNIGFTPIGQNANTQTANNTNTTQNQNQNQTWQTNNSLLSALLSGGSNVGAAGLIPSVLQNPFGAGGSTQPNTMPLPNYP